ncbi:MAG: hypothetical protein ACRDZR_04175, partial [Acidimicrobiales bacterium]
VVAGPWVARSGPRLPMVTGCVLAAAGILATSAVLGVAVLGSIVNSKLTGQLAARLGAIGIPPSFQSLVLRAVTGGGLGSSGQATSAEHSKNATVARIATKVVHAAYDAFGAGLHQALEISGALLLLGAVVAALTIHRSHHGAYEL